MQELEDVADSFPALGWETLLIGRVLQRHNNQRIQEATEHEEVVDEKIAPGNEKHHSDV